MGDNALYTIFEKTVIRLYDAGRLDKAALDGVMEVYRGTDIDVGGRQDLKTHDGKDIDAILFETYGVTPPTPPAEPYSDDSEAWEAYVEERCGLILDIENTHGWNT